MQWLKARYIDNRILTENPLHLAAIGKFLLNAIKVLPRHFPNMVNMFRDLSL